MAEFGGPAGLAKELKKTYTSAREGSTTRAQVLSNYMRLLVQHGDEDDDKEDNPEEIEARLKELTKKK